MKKTLHILLAALLVIMLRQQSIAQATLISNNTYINSGFVLPGSNRPVLQDKDGGLWTTNGTTVSKVTTTVTKMISAGGALYNNKVYFAGTDATTKDVELWVTDGTATGTKLIANINLTGSSTPSQFFVLNNSLYFTADDGIHGRELWKSNGAVGNASFLGDINSGTADGISQDASFFQNGNTVFIPATSGVDSGLWKMDFSGTPILVKNFTGTISLSTNYCAALGSKIVFTVYTGDQSSQLGNAQFWVTDGTTNGTQLLIKDFGTVSVGLLPQFVPYKGLLFFDGLTQSNGDVDIELWTTDGTPANTKLFKDLDTSGSSFPVLESTALINGKMYFSARTVANGDELWVTDGTVKGTTLFKDINPGAGDASPDFLINTEVLNSQTNSGIDNDNFNWQQANSTPFNGKWYFLANDGTHGKELWSTDGTPDGTQMVKDINPGAGDGWGDNEGSYYTTKGIYYVGDNGTSGAEPFVTDGTANGTKLVADINPTLGASSNPRYLFLFNNQIYLAADNGNNNNAIVGDNPDLYRINQTVVLPVDLKNFTAALRDSDVSVNWATANEVNTKNFVVERSTDGVHFNALGTVAAAGNSNTARQYQFTDASALQAGASNLYYRLRIVDNDGKYSYTAILPVQLQGGMFRITLSPNPVHNQLSVAFSTGNAKTATLRVTDANGKVIYQQQFQTNGIASTQQYINVAKYAAGSYFVQLITDKDTKTAQFVKQ